VSSDNAAWLSRFPQVQCPHHHINIAFCRAEVLVVVVIMAVAAGCDSALVAQPIRTSQVSVDFLVV
jgi:hypothetical protein